MAAVASNMIGHIQTQLTRSLERILEDAQASGELKLSGRKLKDFPNSGSKYNLTDTVIADLSKNRLSELPSEITTFLFLERLVLYHNVIRSISDSVVTLQSLTYLDLSRNQLTTLPKEICQLPLQILLVSSNRLTCLPDELGRMSELTELDASCNQITHLPHHLNDLTQLRSLILRCNRLLCLSVEITNLQLERLDIRENRIASLPVELRYMQSLIDLQLDDNPLTMPPAYLCKRGRVHVFKYLELEAAQRNRSRAGGVTDIKRSSSRRSTGSSQIKNMQLQEGLRHKRHNVDSGYSTSDGFDKRWSQEMQGGTEEMVRRSWANRDTSPLTVCTTETSSTQSGVSTPSTISPGDRGSTDGGLDNAGLSDVSDKYDRFVPIVENGIDHHTSSRISTTDNLVNGNSVDDRIRQPLTHIQTYREYKEALRQQRNQDAPSIYRSKQLKTEPNTPTHQTKHGGLATSKSDPTPLHSALSGPPRQIFDDTSSTNPVKKIVSRNDSFSPTRLSLDNGNNGESDVSPKYVNKQSPYVKPPSPVKNSGGTLSHDHVPSPGKVKIAGPKSAVNGSSNGGVKNSNAVKSPRTLTWNKDIPPEKLSFTMRREFDKAREESDLIEQLRNILETRLKMALPDDLAPALTDGVVLCHLANHVKPRSVASIHVPSPAVPKLTMARCRKNVDNFLEACRRIGVEENLVCCAADVLEGRGLVQVAITVTELLRFHKSPLHHGFNGTTPHPTVI